MSLFAVEIQFGDNWYLIDTPFPSRESAEWAIARWRQANGSNGQDTGFRVVIYRK